jgi:Cof subfamily protein (haloacid dehalogenase superfamily)
MRQGIPEARTAKRLSGPGVALPRLEVAAIDLDGTLLNSRHQVSDASRAAISAAREAGLQIILASSRAPAAMWPILEDLGLLDPEVFVASQGAVIASYSTDGQLMPILDSPVPIDAARQILAAARSLDLTVNWFAGDQWMASRLDDHVRREAGIVGFTPELSDLDELSAGPDKLMFMVAPEETDKLARLAALLPGTVNTQISNPTYLEVTRAEVDKASSVRILCEAQAIRPEQVVAFGDGPNDLGLFAYAGTSIATANARDSVLDAATFITSSNDDDGVACALRFILDHNERHNK